MIADGKRGDVPVTAAAYAQALAGDDARRLAGEVAGLGADAFTANPLLGVDALEPLLASGAGVFVLVRTSNPGAADVQDLGSRTARPLWERLARLVDELGGAGEPASPTSAPSSARRAPEHLARARELMPHAIFLLPGVGAQGGRVEDLGAGVRARAAPAASSAPRARSPRAHEQRGGDHARRRARGGRAAARRSPGRWRA